MYFPMDGTYFPIVGILSFSKSFSSKGYKKFGEVQSTTAKNRWRSSEKAPVTRNANRRLAFKLHAAWAFFYRQMPTKSCHKSEKLLAIKHVYSTI
jgi:hypothetical protein